MTLWSLVIPWVVDVDYYLERIAVKLADFFGAFTNVVIFIFVVAIFCSFILWLIVPIVELHKRALLKKIYERLLETQELVYSIRDGINALQRKNKDDADL